MKELKDKIAFITGASSGIGEACAKAFSHAGCKLILAARRSDRLKILAASLKTASHLIQLDVRDRYAVEAAVNELPKEWQKIDILLNNAGLSRGLDKTQDGNPDGWDEMIDTNIKGLLYVSRAILPGMLKRNHGHVINIGSIAGHEVYPKGNVYCASKFAVDALTRGMRMDLVDTGVRVTTVDPGLVETEFSLVRYYGDKERAKKTYQGYKPLTGDDIADAVLWSASRPPHVQIAEIIILPKDQASTMVVNKKE
ncbi:MAG TPA: SDR family oxidoreductase [candidate division Zixibacteria bacterium]|nr:SDR family oxidoreductase [candidate division Zixibacteria bacterium]